MTLILAKDSGSKDEPSEIHSEKILQQQRQEIL